MVAKSVNPHSSASPIRERQVILCSGIGIRNLHVRTNLEESIGVNVVNEAYVAAKTDIITRNFAES